MKVAIHQPNFLPWEPYFRKIAEVDLFVFLRHCQWDKGGNQNRFRLNDQWFTMSVHQGLEPVSAKRYAKPGPDWSSIKGRLPRYKGILRKLDDLISENLCQTNMAIIERIMRWLEIETTTALDYPTDLLGTARLVDICKHFGATVYVSNPGGQRYLDQSLFDQCGIKVEFTPVVENPKQILEVMSESAV